MEEKMLVKKLTGVPNYELCLEDGRSGFLTLRSFNESWEVKLRIGHGREGVKEISNSKARRLKNELEKGELSEETFQSIEQGLKYGCPC